MMTREMNVDEDGYADKLVSETIIHFLPLPADEQANQADADDELVYTEWLVQVNRTVREMALCSIADLPAFNYDTLFAGRATPLQAALSALQAAGR